jgi:hypothetical protein
MEDTEFLQKLKEKIEASTGTPIHLEIDREDKRRLLVDLGTSPVKVTLGADVLENAGLARMFSQYAILCLKERRVVQEQEFLLYLRRN